MGGARHGLADRDAATGAAGRAGRAGAGIRAGPGRVRGHDHFRRQYPGRDTHTAAGHL